MTPEGTEHVKVAVDLGSQAHLRADPLGMALALGGGAATEALGYRHCAPVSTETSKCGR